MKVLNLYAGIGGNRKLWKDVKVVAVEWDREIAKVYEYNFPGDEIVIADAHEFLIENFKEFDFIWSSPPCPTHSRARFWGWKNEKPIYPDMSLYQEIIFLKHFYDKNWVVENVIPYYDFLIKPNGIVHRHAFWSNKPIPNKDFSNLTYFRDNVLLMEKEYGIYVGDMLKGKKKRIALRNCVHPEVGKYVFDVVNGRIGGLDRFITENFKY